MFRFLSKLSLALDEIQHVDGQVNAIQPKYIALKIAVEAVLLSQSLILSTVLGNRGFMNCVYVYVYAYVFFILIWREIALYTNTV